MNNRTRRKIKLSRYATVLGAGGHDPSVYRSVAGTVLDVRITIGKAEMVLPVEVHVDRGIARVHIEVVGAGGGGGGRGVSQGTNGATFVSTGGWSGYTAHATGGAGGSHATDHCGADGRCDVQSLTFLAPTVVDGDTAQ